MCTREHARTGRLMHTWKDADARKVSVTHVCTRGRSATPPIRSAYVRVNARSRGPVACGGPRSIPGRVPGHRYRRSRLVFLTIRPAVAPRDYRSSRRQLLFHYARTVACSCRDPTGQDGLRREIAMGTILFRDDRQHGDTGWSTCNAGLRGIVAVPFRGFL